MATVSLASPDCCPASGSPFLRRNYLLHCIDGGLFIGGMAFVAGNTILPGMVQSLGGSTWLVALMPIAMGAGMMCTPLLTAHWIETRSRMIPLILATGVFMRLPYLIAGVTLLYFAEDFPTLALVAVAVTPFLTGLAGGTTYAAWMELLAKTVPQNRVSSVWAMRNILGAAIGIVAGTCIITILERHPGVTGYGILHLVTFAFLAGSWVLFFLMREPATPPTTAERVGLMTSLRRVPGIIQKDRRLLSYLLCRSLTSGIFIAVPFLAIHVLKILNRPESYLGILVTAQMFGSILGNIVGAFLGNRYGGRVVIGLGIVLHATLLLWATLNQTAGGFFAIFVLFGMAFVCCQIGLAALSLEISPSGKRISYVSIMAMVDLPAMVLASLLGGILRNFTDNFSFPVVLALLTLLPALIFLPRIRQPL